MRTKRKFVVVANRLPVHRVKRGASTSWEISPGGLVAALTPVLRNTPSAWVGWAGIAGRAPEPFEHGGITNIPVGLTGEELAGYYEGFSNRTIWPLYHDALRPPVFQREWWRPYVEVNRRFAQAASEASARGATVWVHDYQLQLVPGMLRGMRPDLRIGFFLHIPFPPQELFARLPWRLAILEGLLGADVVGFHTRVGAQNFAQLCRRFLGARTRPGHMRFQGRMVRFGAFPISIDVERYASLAADPRVIARARSLRARLGLSRRVILGVDRLDYTKGIDLRLAAYREMLAAGRVRPEECVFVQTAVPSREHVEEYKEQRVQVERMVGQINGEFGEVGRTPVHYLHRNLPIEELVAMYVAADVMLVTPLRDGMNLIAKEYVATRLDNTGVLVLSEFTGAATELTSALLVNPYDVDGVALTLEAALRLPESEQVRRMRRLRRAVQEHDVHRWAESFLRDLAS